MKIILSDGTRWELAGVSEEALKAYFGPFSKDGYSVTDTRMKEVAGVWMWSGELKQLQTHIGEMAEQVALEEETASMEERSLLAMEIQSEALMRIARALEIAVDEWIARG